MPFVATNGIQMHYEVEGQGDPVLLIMGITAPGSVWARHAAHWQQSFRCLMPDNRGVGRTNRPRGPYTTAQMADDHAGLLDALDLPSVRVVGCSMGSAIALQLALRHPARVRSLVLCCPWARCDARTARTFEQLVRWRRQFRPGEFTAAVQWLIHSPAAWAEPSFRAEAEEACRRAANTPWGQTVADVVAQAAACVGHDVVDHLSQIRAPTLVLGGEEDQFTPAWMAREVAAGIPGAELHLYPGAGHGFHWECIEDFNPRCEAWLARH